MNSCRYKTGVTLVEILTVVAIIAILASIVVGIVSRIDNKAKEQLAENTIAIIANALEQFHDYEYRYGNINYSEFKFPLDCNDFTQLELGTALVDALGATSVAISGGVHDPNDSGSEVLYFFLSKVPACRTTLDRIDSSLITSEDDNGNEMKIEIDFNGVIESYPLRRFVDPWLERGKRSRTGKTLRYDYYDEWQPTPALKYDSRRTFPVITSAGPDGKFDTLDDITSR